MPPRGTKSYTNRGGRRSVSGHWESNRRSALPTRPRRSICIGPGTRVQKGQHTWRLWQAPIRSRRCGGVFGGSFFKTFVDSRFTFVFHKQPGGNASVPVKWDTVSQEVVALIKPSLSGLFVGVFTISGQLMVFDVTHNSTSRWPLIGQCFCIVFFLCQVFLLLCTKPASKNSSSSPRNERQVKELSYYHKTDGDLPNQTPFYSEIVQEYIVAMLLIDWPKTERHTRITFVYYYYVVV